MGVRDTNLSRLVLTRKVETMGGEPLVGEVKKIWDGFSLVSDSAEGIRVPFDRDEARRLADEIADGASLKALG